MGLGKSIKKGISSFSKAVVDPASAIKRYTGIDKKYIYGAAALGGLGYAALAPSTAAAASGAGSSGFWSTPAAGGLVAGGLGLVGSGLNAIGQRQANEAGLQSAREQMQFQEYMSSTAHQREVKDLEAAGLNPVLSANAGASSASGAMFAPENEMPDIGPAINSALSGIKLAQELKLGDQQIGLLGAQKDLTIANAQEAREKSAMISAQRVMQELENELYIQNGKLMITEHGVKIIKSLSEEARGWVSIAIAAKFGREIVSKGTGKLKGMFEEGYRRYRGLKRGE